MSKPERFVFLTDLHFGYERRSGHKIPIHDLKALHVAMSFIKDFKPHHVILGGDMLDCGAISHHNHGKPGNTEGLKIISDAKELRDLVIQPLESLVKGRLVYHIGNHEDWLNQLVELLPGLEGIVEPRPILGLGKRWEVIERGEFSKLGKLVFIHGDQIKGGVHIAKNATEAFERNVRLGHYHTYQTFTKVSAVDMNGHTGVAVPCLCKKGPKYGGGNPNRWLQGFLYGYIGDGVFADYVAVIINGKSIIEGKLYQG